jgi:DNA-binding response OmpR family regulator
MKHVLVAEDDSATLNFIVAALGDEGYTVTAVPDGKSALERCAEVKPDLVVLDLNLPILDGFEFLRRRGPDCAAPVVAVSAAFRVSQLRGLKVAAFVAKPFDLNVLVAAIARSIGPGGEPQPATRPLN